MKLLLCLYTCEQDQHFRDSLWHTALMQGLQSDPKFRILEVYADEGLTQATLVGDRLTVNCREAYTFLSIKTYLMIQSALGLDFDFLLKLDATIVRYGDKKHKKSKQMSARLTPDAVESCLVSPTFFDTPYNGLMSQSANLHGFESWARTKNIHIDYAKVFPGLGRTPEYFLGKYYSLSRDFCQFIADYGREMAFQHHRHLGGSEDVLIGRLYQLWKDNGRPPQGIG
jgi:hypothetical protein